MEPDAPDDYRVRGNLGSGGNSGEQRNVAGKVEGDQVYAEHYHAYAPPDVQKDRRNRGLLLEFLRDEVEGRLRSSLHGRLEQPLNPGKISQAERVRRSWDALVKMGSQPEMVLKPETRIREVFDNPEVRGKLLILGVPGAGKTTMLLELARDLLAEVSAERGRIPVLLNLSAWKQEPGKPMEDWLAAQLKDKYGVRVDIGVRWWQEGQLLPLLDGLDELAIERQEACVAAINGLRLPQVVVCSRLEGYRRLEGRLALNGAICLHPLADGQIRDYLA